MLQTLRNAWKIPELRKKLLYTVLMLVIFRLGSYIPVPGLTSDAISQFMGGFDGGMQGLLNNFSGGALERGSIFAMSISPYINASIIIQLLTVAIPALERMAKEGIEGRKKINKITRYVGIILAFVQGAGLYVTLHNLGVQNNFQPIANENWLSFTVIVLTFVAGTAFIMWLGEVITEKGLGNGVSMIIFAGIVSAIPSGIGSVWNHFIGDGNVVVSDVIYIALIVIFVVAAIAFVVLFNSAERKIPVQYAKRVVGRKMYGGQSTNIPIKVVSGGVMPIIFASSIMAFPSTIVRLATSGNIPQSGIGATLLQMLSPGTGPAWTNVVYAVLYFLLIIFFTYFYASIQFNPVEIANNIKKNGGFIPAIRPGKPTSDYIAKVSNRLNLAGAIFLGIIAILPVFAGALFGMTSLQIGGTSLLIMEGVALETGAQIESQMVMRHYKGFLE